MHKRIPLFTALILLMVSTHVAGAADIGTNPTSTLKNPSRLEIQVHEWMDMLSGQPQFHSWKNAVSAIMPIGPGTHGFLVSISLERRPIGYMIVNATEDGGYALGEYGVGSHPAFDPDTLYLSLVRQGLIESYSAAIKKPLRLERLYVHPLLAVWKWDAADGQTYYLDAWTGEALPIDNAMWHKQLAAATLKSSGPVQQSAVKSLSDTRLNDAFDPYETMPWLTQAPLSEAQLGSLSKLLDNKAKIRYTSELFDQTVLFVWPMIGYHNWNHQTLYAAFDQMGTRYVPLSALTGNGSFFQ
ncbi:hypothetical protein [Paenibacillus nasutitermitis]|uniref:Uncharacterized protein n=1 Tax=Paenibacillus nasutitermitis TaxID=1652958 RepID=A0A917DQD3_9BACL|nr:hypothetical protein [Paenibacillus nasutitermitis]GGD56614.1 hypothetical protein GCM10010911_12900 [Paenibacillus nasutitermitis]